MSKEERSFPMPIKILHTSDWHLGKKLYQFKNPKEQELFLDWLLERIIQLNIDFLIVAGDIFDVPRPNAKSVSLFYRFLHQIESKTLCKALIIAGNHDCGQFLETPSELIEHENIFLIGRPKKNFDDHILILSPRDSSKKDKIKFSLLPYFRTHEMINLMKEHEHDELVPFLNDLFTQLGQHYKQDESILGHILIAHHLFGSFEYSGSEQMLALSGIDSISPSLLENHFDYVALGHIHRPQVIRKRSPHIYYSGTPYPLRFSEKEQKSLALLTFSSHQEFTKEIIPIPQYRLLSSIKTDLEHLEENLNLIKEKHQSYPLKCALELNITLKKPDSTIADFVREALKDSNTQLISLFIHHQDKNNQDDEESVEDLEKIQNLSTIELFKSFYQKKYPDSKSVPSEMINDFKILLEKMNSEEEEESSMFQVPLKRSANHHDEVRF